MSSLGEGRSLSNNQVPVNSKQDKTNKNIYLFLINNLLSLKSEKTNLGKLSLGNLILNRGYIILLVLFFELIFGKLIDGSLICKNKLNIFLTRWPVV